MRSGEISFYMSLIDEQIFVEFVFTKYNADIIRDIPYTSKNLEIYSDSHNLLLQRSKNPNSGLAIWSIWFKNVGDLVLRRFNMQGKLYFEIDTGTSPVIVFSRCITENNIIHEGRIAFHGFNDYPDNEKLNIECNQLIKNFNQLRRWIKKHSVKLTYDGSNPIRNTYIMDDAVKLYNTGTVIGTYIYGSFIPEGYSAPGVKISQD